MISDKPIQCSTTTSEISFIPKEKNRQENCKSNRKKTQNVSFSCDQHNNSITSICTRKNCPEKDILLCHLCVFEKHLTHSSECIPIELFFKSLLAKHTDTEQKIILPTEKEFHKQNQLCLALIDGIVECFTKKMKEIRQKLQNFGDHQVQVSRVKGKEINDFVKNLLDGNCFDGQFEMKHLMNFKSSIKSLISQMDLKVNADEKDICLEVRGYKELEAELKKGLEIMSSLFEDMKDKFKSVFDHVKMVKVPMDINVCLN